MRANALFLQIAFFVIHTINNIMNTVFDYTVKDRKGNAVPLRNYANEVLLIVNTAIKSEAVANVQAIFKRSFNR